MADNEQQSEPAARASGDPAAGQGQGEQASPGSDQPTQEELRAQLEDQLRRVRVQDILLESVASILNLSARRIAKEDERDLDQARLGIDAVRAVVDLLEPEPREQVRQALSELQMLYAREAGGGAPGEPGAAPGGEPAAGGGEAGPGKRDSGLWTPPGSA